MKPSLEALRLRVDCAWRDFYALSREMQRALDNYGLPVGTGFQDDPRGDGVFIVATSVMPPSFSWTLGIAHIVYDLRSTLDHLVRQLYIATNRRAPTGKVAKDMMFRISDRKSDRKRPTSRMGFDSLSKRWLADIDPRYIKIIREHQPYRMRLKTRHALTRLDRLSNLDKHRDDYVLMFAARDFSVDPKPNPNTIIVQKTDLVDFGRPMKVGAKLAHVEMRPIRAGKYGVYVKVNGSLEPTFADGYAVIDTLKAIFTEVRTILYRCGNAIGPDVFAPPQGPPLPKRSRSRIQPLLPGPPPDEWEGNRP